MSDGDPEVLDCVLQATVKKTDCKFMRGACMPDNFDDNCDMVLGELMLGDFE